jgi:hypothetical protein
MPAKPRWLLHIPEILDQLRALQVPVVDRAVCERIFSVGRRRAISLMQCFGGYRSGNAVLVDRLELIAKLEDLWESPDAVSEQKRKTRLADRLESVRRYQKAAAVVIPVSASSDEIRLPELPVGIAIESGRLTVEFNRTEELLQRLFEVAKAAANDFEAFQAVVERNRPASG